MKYESETGDARPYDAVNIIVAILLIAAPWVLGFSGDHIAALSSCIAGAAIAVCAMSALGDFPQIFRGVDTAIGLLTAAAPWLFQFAHDHKAMAAHLVVGLIVAGVSAGELWWTGGHPPTART